jgi:hypothetical protein
MRLIVLAAGDSFELDGFPKPLIRHPRDGATILDRYLELFPVDAVTVVVGFRAMEIMNAYPQLDYVYNRKWRATSNSYSLGLALSEEPCFVVSGDYFVGSSTIALFDDVADGALVDRRENRRPTSLNCRVEDGCVAGVYPGRAALGDPELLGIFKVSNPALLSAWKRACRDAGNLFVGQNLPVQETRGLRAIERGDAEFVEINDALDYIALQQHVRG